MSKEELVNALLIAQGQLDNERSRQVGRYAFYHRHLAMSYVRQRDPGLANQAMVDAGHRIKAEGGLSYEDAFGCMEDTLHYLLACIEHE